MNQGGKGANQAVTVARLQGDVSFVCKTGNDLFREQSLEIFKKEGISTKWILVDNEKPSGIAFILVNDTGENSIVVASGANGRLFKKDIVEIEEVVDQSSHILMQLEIPLETVEYIANLASQKDKTVILNPAPAMSLPAHLFQKLDFITPNKIEAEVISGIPIKDKKSLREAAKIILDKGVKHVIITLGKEGAIYYDGKFEWIPAEQVDPIDTTGAGDVFNGAFIVALVEGLSMGDAVSFANRAAAISITRNGAIPSIPYRHEILR
jgi:ribokinase